VQKALKNQKSRRLFLLTSFVTVLSLTPARMALAQKIEKLVLSDKEWRMKLTEKQFKILRKEGTEKPWSSPLNDEKREGVYHCAGCDLALFTSEMKYDSGTGWPSFYTHIEDALETKLDFKLIVPRTEYHCARCGGHQGHVFKDGPEPTGQRWCNNGEALRFVPHEKG
tara:strand:+ start:1232 stop:1735 length:504 start_codon:yes stop_codon:yes gene_type:complete